MNDAHQVQDNQAESRFELWVDGRLAELFENEVERMLRPNEGT